MKANLLLLKEYFEINDYHDINNQVEVLVCVLDLIDTHKDELFVNPDFYNLSLYNDIWDTYRNVKTKIPHLENRIFKELQKFFSRTHSNSTSNNLGEWEQEKPNENNGLLGWIDPNLPTKTPKLVITEQDWFHLHYLYYLTNPADDSYFLYNEKRHLTIENIRYETNLNYLSDVKDAQYIDLQPNKGVFSDGEKKYFIFPNLHLSNRQKPWHLMYSGTLETNEKIKAESHRFPYDFRCENVKEVEALKKEHSFLNASNKQLAIDWAEMVAKLNYYHYSEDVSAHNNDPKIKHQKKSKKKTPYKIYEAGAGKNRIFLSVDFEFAMFEVCNYKGEHLGEYRFDGKWNKEADPKGEHDIEIPK